MKQIARIPPPQSPFRRQDRFGLIENLWPQLDFESINPGENCRGDPVGRP